MRTVFITGAAEGQGLGLAKKMDELGWKVFAGVLPGLDVAHISEGTNITTIEQDVSNTDSVKQSAKEVLSHLEDGKLNMLVNNAGIANTAQGVVEGFDLDEMQRLFEVNTFGQVRTVQSFLPMLRKAAPDARIINYASGAVVANPPGSGCYNMSKHAVVGMNQTLRHELAGLGVQSTVILPGGVHTGMTEDIHNTTHNIWDKVSPELREVYGPHLMNPTTKVLPDMVTKYGSDTAYMTDAMIKIIAKSKWKPIYLVGKDVGMLKVMRGWLSDSGLESMLRKVYKVPSKLQS